MLDNPAIVNFKHYGISPWEINVITSLLQKKFYTNDEEFERDYDSKYVSMINMPIPYSFNGEFFKWFEYKIQHLIYTLCHILYINSKSKKLNYPMLFMYKHII